MNPQSLLRIERTNYLLGTALAVAAAFTRSRAEAAGVAVGVVLTCLNFALLRRIIFKMTAEAAAGRASSSGLLMLPKMMGLMAAVAVALLVLPISAPAFAVGYSIFVVSIVIEAVRAAVAPTPPPDNAEGSHG